MPPSCSTLTGALNDEIAPTSYSLAAIPISSIKPLVIENWETGKVEVSDFWQSARVNALAPFRQVSVNSNDTVTCEMHVLCFEAQRYKCGISGWTQLGSDTYTLGRRLAARRLQSLGRGGWKEHVLEGTGHLSTSNNTLNATVFPFVAGAIGSSSRDQW
eukprot:g5225.t1